MENNEIDKLIELLGEDDNKKPKKSNSSIKGIIDTLWAKRKYYFITIPLGIAIALVYSMSLPKFYQVKVKLAPELSNSLGNGGGLSNIMKTLGMSRSSSNNQEGDAILPNLYPDLLTSQVFLVSLFDIPVVSKDGSIQTTYYEYLSKHQKSPWWAGAVKAIKDLMPSFGDDEEAPVTNNNQANVKEAGNPVNPINPTALNSKQEGIAKAIAGKIVCDVDKKTYVITITVTDQDPVICATVADSTCQRLQEFITDYRTKKARIEYEHLLEETDKAQRDFELAKQNVADFNDANWDLVDADYLLERQTLQNEMQMRFSAYSTMYQQLLMARTKVDEAKPVFTVLDGANVPLKPAGPQKKKILMVFVFLSFVVQTLWILYREQKRKKKEKRIEQKIE